MSKSEKLQSNLKDMFAKAGMSLEDAEKEAKRLMQAGTILEQINKSKAETETVTDTVIKADDDKLNNAERNEADEPKKLFNPFEKK